VLSKSDRLLRLVKLLLRKRKLSTARIAEKLGVTERTTYRDLNALEDMGWKIRFDGGYYIARNSRCPMCGKPVELKPFTW